MVDRPRRLDRLLAPVAAPWMISRNPRFPRSVLLVEGNETCSAIRGGSPENCDVVLEEMGMDSVEVPESVGVDGSKEGWEVEGLKLGLANSGRGKERGSVENSSTSSSSRFVFSR